MLNVRHRAWLACTPEKENQSRYEKYSSIDSPLAELPPVDYAAYLIDYLMEVGPVMSGAMGPTPITFGEIHAWASVTGTIINAWDARMLRYLSRCYVNEFQDAKDRNRPAPWIDSMPIEDKRAAVVAGFKALSDRAKK